MHGDRVVVGSHYDDEIGRDAGAVYVFELADGVWAVRIEIDFMEGGFRQFMIVSTHNYSFL